MANRDSEIESRRAYLLRRVRDADVKRSDSQKLLDNLKKEMVELQKLREEADKHVDTTTRYVDDAFEDCLKFEVRLITDAMNERLPRELRDMIWSFCWADDLSKYDEPNYERPWRAHGVPQDTVQVVDDYEIGPHERAQGLGPYPIRHLADTEYMSQNSARESAEMFYRMAPALIETLDQCDLETYFREDIFGLGLEPRNYVTSVVFFLDHCAIRDDISLGRPGRFLDTLKLNQKSMRTIFGCRQHRLPGVIFYVFGDATRVLTVLPQACQFFDQLNEIGATITIESTLEGTVDFPYRK